MDLASDVAVVTGAASGIGRAVTHALAEAGASVVAVDLDGPGLDVTCSTARHSENVRPMTADVADEATAARAVATAEREFGRLTVVVNNAAISVPGTLTEVSVADFDRSYAVNVRGPFVMTRHALPALRRANGGSIINVGSVNSFYAERGLATYSTTKGALLMLTKSVALDHAREGIRCNIVCPGYVDTPLNLAHSERLGGHQSARELVREWQPIGRDGRAQEVAEVVLFLASDSSSFMTGSVVTVDGGLTAGL